MAAIDGVPVVQPVNEQQIEALLTRLGDAGLDAAGGYIESTIGDQSQVVAEAKK